MSKVYKTLAVLLLALGFFTISGEANEVAAAKEKLLILQKSYKKN